MTLNSDSVCSQEGEHQEAEDSQGCWRGFLVHPFLRLSWSDVGALQQSLLCILLHCYVVLITRMFIMFRWPKYYGTACLIYGLMSVNVSIGKSTPDVRISFQTHLYIYGTLTSTSTRMTSGVDGALELVD